MKLLLDANLAPRLSRQMDSLFPGSKHVTEVGLAANTPDMVIWEYAREHGFAVVSADSDFLDLAARRGRPPAVIHLANCNYRTRLVEDLLRRNSLRIAEFENSDRAVLVLRLS